MKIPESKLKEVIKSAKAQEEATSEFLCLFDKGENVNHVGEVPEIETAGTMEVEVEMVEHSTNSMGIFNKLLSFIPFLGKG